MAIDINGLPPVIPQGSGSTQGKEDNTRNAQSGAQTANPAITDKVTLTETLERLQALVKETDQLPIVDANRVADIRAAISEGTYTVNADRVAEKMLDLERQLEG